MKKTLVFALVVTAMMASLVACQPKERTVYVASINDMHANIDNFPKLAHVVDSLRAIYPDMLLFSAGDNRSGNPINDRYSEPARPMVDLMNAVGFDLSAFGNHEWDNGILGLRDVMEVSNFPYICANVTFDDSLHINSKPYIIFERNGLKIGVIGAIQLGLNGILIEKRVVSENLRLRIDRAHPFACDLGLLASDGLSGR